MVDAPIGKADHGTRVFFEEMLGWQQKVHSLIFWIENALHPCICDISIQIGNFIYFLEILVFVWLFHLFFFCVLVLKIWCRLIIFGAIWR
jgi:hypothetical protein